MTSLSLTVNQTVLAELLKVSPKTVQQWDREGLAKAARLRTKGRSAKYDVSAAFWWYHHRELTRVQESHDVQEARESAARLRKLEAEAESKELDVEVKRGMLVPLDEVDEVVRACNEAVDSVLRNSPARFGPKLAKAAKIRVKEARVIIRDIVELARSSIREEAVETLSLRSGTGG